MTEKCNASLVSGHATYEGTRHYAARFPDAAAAGNYRKPRGCSSPTEDAPLISSVGIGTYLGTPDASTDQAYVDALVAAVEGGINIIDSAINYRFQRSERSIGLALAELARRGFAREEICLCTKAGYLTPDGSIPGGVSAYFEREYLQTGILRREEIAEGGHAMSPRFLADQLDRSRSNLGVCCIDIYYLHNPETQLGTVSRQDFMPRLRAAFELLESAAAEGKIRFYGLATWNGFRQPESAADFLSLSEIEQLAREVAGAAHRFRFVQLPFNLAMTEALTRSNQAVHGPAVSLVEAAEALDISLIASATLLQGKLVRGLPPFIADALGMRSDSQRAIQFVRASPSVLSALVGMSSVDHVRANLQILAEPRATAEQLARLFARGQESS